ncbi:hypothetical protein F4861DRAFT_544606 [Xylaria intraflava]|nr:hypothetical protein F4861DRAFT_544606 [Xylaria intraflava]
MAATTPNPRASVRFDIRNQEQPEPQTELHEKATGPLRHSFTERSARRQEKEPETDEGLLPDLDDCEYYAKHVLKAEFENGTHQVGPEGLANELTRRYEELSEFWAPDDEGNSITPFKIYGAEVEGFPIKNGPLGGALPINEGRFVELVNEYPDVVFDQFRIRSLAMDALYSTVADLNHIANVESDDLQTLHGRIHKFAEQVSSLKAQLAQARTELRDSNTIRVVLENETAQQKSEIDDLNRDIAGMARQAMRKGETSSPAAAPPVQSTTPPTRDGYPPRQPSVSFARPNPVPTFATSRMDTATSRASEGPYLRTTSPQQGPRR